MRMPCMFVMGGNVISGCQIWCAWDAQMVPTVCSRPPEQALLDRALRGFKNTEAYGHCSHFSAARTQQLPLLAGCPLLPPALHTVHICNGRHVVARLQRVWRGHRCRKGCLRLCWRALCLMVQANILLRASSPH